MKKLLFIVILLSLGLNACSSEDIDDNQINLVADPNTDGSSTTQPQHLIRQPLQLKPQWLPQTLKSMILFGKA